MVFWKRTGLPTPVTAAGGLAMASIPIVFFHSTTGYANLPFATYLVLGALGLTSGVQAGRVGEITTGSILLGLAAWTRPEGGAFGALGILCVCLANLHLLRRTRVLAGILVPFSLLAGLWAAFGAGYQANDEMGATLRAFLGGFPDAAISAESAKVLIGYASSSFAAFGTWGFMVVLVVGLGAISLATRKVGRHPVLLSSAIAALAWLLAAAAMLYAAWPSHPDYQMFLAVSFDRAMFPGALLMLWAVVAASGMAVGMGPVAGSGARNAM
jgi:hypothetical protein